MWFWNGLESPGSYQERKSKTLVRISRSSENIKEVQEAPDTCFKFLWVNDVIQACCVFKRFSMLINHLDLVSDTLCFTTLILHNLFIYFYIYFFSRHSKAFNVTHAFIITFLKESTWYMGSVSPCYVSLFPLYLIILSRKPWRNH